jgi:hypothetical protein
MCYDQTRNKKMVIDSVHLHYKKVQVTDQCLFSILSELNVRPAVYPIIRSECITFLRLAGTSQITQTLCTNAQTPNVIFIMPVPADAYQGLYNLNPFKIDTVGLQEVYVTVEGSRYPPEPLDARVNEAEISR